MQVTIDIHPTQDEFCESPALYRGFVGGRGAGKTWVGAFDLMCRAQPGRNYLVGSPTGVMLSDTTYPTFKNLAQQIGVWESVKLTPYPNATLTNGATIRFRTAEDPEKMRGPNLSGVWLDEASLMGFGGGDSRAYDLCIAALRERGEQGWLSATFTPKGPSHWTYQVFATGRPDTAIFRARTGDNPFNPVGFEQTLQKQYGETQFARQELGGEFVSIAGAEFPPEWFEWDGFWFDEWPANLSWKCIYLDPSKGVSDFAGDAKKNLEGDYQAFCLAAVDTSGTIYLDAELNREDPVAMIARGIRLIRDWAPVHDFSFEDNGTMGFMAPEVVRQLTAAKLLVPWNPITNTAPKIQRIRRLATYLSLRQIRIRRTRGGKLLREQLGDLPFGFYDDGADAAAGAVSRLEMLTVGGVR